MKLSIRAMALAAALVCWPASAVTVLNFEGVAPTHPNGNDTLVQNFYNGGTSSAGTSGTNFGVGFSENALAICLNTLNVNCSNTSRGGLGDSNSQLGALFFLTGDETFMNVAAGFETGFSFLYVAANTAGSVSVYDGLNGTGNILGTIELPVNGGSCPGYNASFCPFQAVGVTFTGIARSVAFAGVANQIVFDDVTFGSATPGGGEVPEPTTAALLVSAVAGLAIARRRFGR